MSGQPASTRTAAAPPRPATAIPGPRGLPLLASGRQLVRDPLGTYQRAMQTHGDLVRFVAGPPGRRIVLHAPFASGRPVNLHRQMTGYTLRVLGRLQTPPAPIPLAAGITLRPAAAVPCCLQPLPTADHPNPT